MIKLLFPFAFFALMGGTIKAQDQSGLISLTPELKQEFLKAHNSWRTDVKVPPLQWSNQMEQVATKWATKQGKKGCKMKHSSNNNYGENLYWSSGRAFSPKDAVDEWGSEIKLFKKNKPFSATQMKAGHYTQVVWRNTTQVGCAAYKCGSKILVVCNYNPAGNWMGQHPYKP